MNGRLAEAVEGLGEDRRQAILPHLYGGTSADWISDWLTRAGHPVSATTIKRWRRNLERESA